MVTRLSVTVIAMRAPGGAAAHDFFKLLVTLFKSRAAPARTRTELEPAKTGRGGVERILKATYCGICVCNSYFGSACVIAIYTAIPRRCSGPACAHILMMLADHIYLYTRT